jgi:UDP-glucose 4-epimerase
VKTLVTGGAGFIGSHLVQALLAAGHDVATVDNLSGGLREQVDARARLAVVDLRDQDALEAVFARERPAVVFHLAAQSSVKASMRDPVADAQINVLGSLTLLERCVRHGVRKVVYASSGGAAVGEPLRLPVDEQHPPTQPLSPYGVSKVVVEQYLWLYRRHHGLRSTTLRYPNVYGPRQDPGGESGVVAIFLGQMLRGEPVTINGSGEQERDFVYVEDIAAASVLALERGDDELLLLGSGHGTSVNELFARLARLTGYDAPARHGPSLPGDVQRIYLSGERARAVLGWVPRVDLESGLSRCLEALRPRA